MRLAMLACAALALAGPAAAEIEQTAPGRYHCSAPPGDYFNKDISPLAAGQELRVAIRLIRENDHPKYHPAASVIFEVPRGRVHVTVGKAMNEPTHLYVAYSAAGTKEQEALWRFPLSNNWIVLTLKLDEWGYLHVRNYRLEHRFEVWKAPTLKAMLHCHSGEFEFDVSSPSVLAAAPPQPTN